MAKGGLKTQLKASKASNKAAVEEDNTPVVTSQKEPKITATPGEKKKERRAKKQQESYQSDVLLKKEQRKAKKYEKLIEQEEDEEEDDEDEEEIERDEVEEDLDLEKLAALESESDLNDEEDDSEEEDDEEEEGEEDDDEEAEEEDVPLSDVELDSDADVVPHTKLTVNNTAALRDSLARIELPWAKHSFAEHQVVVSAEETEKAIKDIYDDTERELAFYKQSLDAAQQAKKTLLKLKVPFSRPLDYFAEMIKLDAHMDKLKTKLLREAADKKALEDAKRQRHLKKFGKQVQNETLQERAKQKRDTLDKIKLLRKRGHNDFLNDDEFQIALEEATKENSRDSRDSRGGDKRHKPNGKRLAKNSKYGFGGQKRGTRRNDAALSADVSGFLVNKMKGKKARPGKSRRK